MNRFFQKHREKFMLLLWAAVVLASIKSILTDTGFDNSYEVAMSFRHLRGDTMFQYMWEPHQTSIFFTDFFMWIYHFFVPSYTGVMIYLQVVGTLFFAIIGFVLYRLLKDVAGSFFAQLAVIFLMMFRAKQTPFPDFSNLQIGFSLLVFLSLVRFVGEQQKKQYLCLAAVFLCLQVLAYPSCILAYVPVVIVLAWKSRERWKDIGLFTGVCALFGGLYVGYFVFRIGLTEFLGNLVNIFYSDSHSGEAYVSAWNYFYGLSVAIAWVILCAALAGGAAWIGKRYLKKSDVFFPAYGLVLFVSELVLLFSQKKTGLDWTCTFYILPLLLMILSCFAYPKMDERERVIWVTGNLFAVVSFLATYLLTDLGLITMVAYMVLGGIVSLVALRHMGKQIEFFLYTVCMLVTVHRGLVVWGYANKGGVWMVQDVEAMVLNGPSVGVVCDYMTYYLIKCDKEDHAKFVTSEDSILIINEWVMDSIEYLLTDAKISNYSTIDTPYNNEKLLDYLELYPEKTPTVVAASCYYGQMQVEESSWIMNWVNENYEAVGEGRYWRYYRPKK